MIFLEISTKIRLKQRKTMKSVLLSIASWIGFGSFPPSLGEGGGADLRLSLVHRGRVARVEFDGDLDHGVVWLAVVE